MVCIDRLARSLIDLKQVIAELTDKGVAVVSHKENLRFTAGTDDPTANLMLGILGSFVEFERSIIRERQAEGIALAKRPENTLADQKPRPKSRLRRRGVTSRAANRRPRYRPIYPVSLPQVKMRSLTRKYSILTCAR